MSSHDHAKLQHDEHEQRQSGVHADEGVEENMCQEVREKTQAAPHGRPFHAW